MSGEKPGRREYVETFTEHLIRHGTDPNKARKVAQDQAKKADRKEKR